MRIPISLTIAAASAAVVGLSSPAAATTISEALQLCKKSGGCTVTKYKDGTNIKYGTNEIYCPDKGQCECVACSPPKRTGGIWGSVKPTVGGVLSPRPAGAASGPKSTPVGAPKTTPSAPPQSMPPVPPQATPSTPSQARSQHVRDHRKPAGKYGGTSVIGTPITYEGAKPASGKGPHPDRQPKIRDHRATPEIRDHRGVDAATRTGPSEKRKPQIRDHRSSSTQPKSSASAGSTCGKQGSAPCQAQ